MRLAMIETSTGPAPAVRLPDGLYAPIASTGPWGDLDELIRCGGPALARVHSALERGDLATLPGAKLLRPLSRPEKIMCIGKNYRDHCAEMKSPLPERPVLFAKYPNTLAGPEDEISLPAVSRMVDWEAELAVVIGRACRNVGVEEARQCVFGYTCANDLTMRDAQSQDGQWVRAKSPDGFCPLGPELVTADEVDNPQALDISLRLNGTVMQRSNTREMVFGVAELVSYLSRTMTLQPGDVLLTGTPPGVGAGRDPQVFLAPGDRVVVEIQGIGALANVMRAEA
ncbi:fumarylacetoacetate hydrolase family protein [bacterium]|nr:fumarylacetoacetate hydrolase family protein [bacterium]